MDGMVIDAETRGKAVTRTLELMCEVDQRQRQWTQIECVARVVLR